MPVALAALALAAALHYEAGAGVSFAGGEFVGGLEGTYEVVTPRAELELEPGLFVDAAVPVAWLQLGSYGLSGLGDVMTEVGWHLGPLRAGVQMMWPTGDPHHGFGTAHLMIAPRVDGAFREGRLLVAASVSVRYGLPLGEHGAHNHQSVIAPHDVLDLPLIARAGVAATSWLEVWAVGAPVITLIPHPIAPVGTRMMVGGEAVVRLGAMQVGLQALVPTTQNRAESWLTTLSFGYGDAAGATECH